MRRDAVNAVQQGEESEVDSDVEARKGSRCSSAGSDKQRSVALQKRNQNSSFEAFQQQMLGDAEARRDAQERKKRKRQLKNQRKRANKRARQLIQQGS
jgi:hypothetical protein